eukprot:jgi/Botrbrau1/10631/Bobra.154_1s0020.1
MEQSTAKTAAAIAGALFLIILYRRMYKDQAAPEGVNLVSQGESRGPPLKYHREKPSPYEWSCAPRGFCNLEEGGCPVTKANPPICPKASCHAKAANYQGDRMVLLDVNSHAPSEDQTEFSQEHPPRVTNAAECCEVCRQTKGCNTWVFCPLEEGCGSCRPQEFNHNPDADIKHHHKRFGPHANACTPSGTFPKLTCSMKFSVNTAQPSPATDADFDVWISGVIEK